jgi:hypothetical protein
MSVHIETPSAGDASWPPPTDSLPATTPGDVATALLACIVRSRGVQQESARQDAEHAYELVERARKEMLEALERAERARENGDFWGDLGDIVGGDVAAVAGVVAAAALVVGTGGAGAPAVVALAAAGLSIGAKAGQELGLDSRVVAAMGVAGAALGLVAGNVASAGSAWTTVTQLANATQGAAAAAGGGATVVEGRYRGDAIDERAEAEAARGRQDDAWFRFDLAIAELERATEGVSRAKERASGIVETEGAGREAILSRMGGA